MRFFFEVESWSMPVTMSPEATAERTVGNSQSDALCKVYDLILTGWAATLSSSLWNFTSSSSNSLLDLFTNHKLVCLSCVSILRASMISIVGTLFYLWEVSIMDDKELYFQITTCDGASFFVLTTELWHGKNICPQNHGCHFWAGAHFHRKVKILWATEGGISHASVSFLWDRACALTAPGLSGLQSLIWL